MSDCRHIPPTDAYLSALRRALEHIDTAAAFENLGRTVDDYRRGRADALREHAESLRGLISKLEQEWGRQVPKGAAQ